MSAPDHPRSTNRIASLVSRVRTTAAAERGLCVCVVLASSGLRPSCACACTYAPACCRYSGELTMSLGGVTCKHLSVGSVIIGNSALSSFAQKNQLRLMAQVRTTRQQLILLPWRGLFWLPRFETWCSCVVVVFAVACVVVMCARVLHMDCRGASCPPGHPTRCAIHVVEAAPLTPQRDVWCCLLFSWVC